MIKRIPSISCSFVLFHSRDSRRLRDVSFENREKYSGAKDQKREDRDYIRERGRNPSYWLPKSIPLFDGTSWILFNKDVSPFSTNTYTYTYIYTVHSSIFIRGFFPSWGEEISKDQKFITTVGCGGAFYGFVGWTPRLILPLSSAGLLCPLLSVAGPADLKQKREEMNFSLSYRTPWS